MAIQTNMSGNEIDRNLRAICDLLKLAEDPANDNKVIYVRRGKQAVDTALALFDIVELT